MKKKILLVDDDRLILSTMSKGLELSGYSVFSALSGDAALQLADSVKLDIAVLDIRIPGMDGLELARRLTENYNLPVVFLSAYSDNETVTHALNCGCMNYLVKPCSLKQLLLTIEAVHKKFKEIRQLEEQHQHLHKALTQSQDICIAIGILMKQYRLDRKKASETLRSEARSARKKIADLARQIVSRT